MNDALLARNNDGANQAEEAGFESEKICLKVSTFAKLKPHSMICGAEKSVRRSQLGSVECQETELLH
jgi:hypothetical protein